VRRATATGIVVLATALTAAGCALPAADEGAGALDLATATSEAASPSPTPSAEDERSETEATEPAATASAGSEPGVETPVEDEPTDAEKREESSDAGTSKAASTSNAKPSSAVTVTHVVDGDTVYTSDGGKIRLIGYDTPERGECGFDDAKAFVANLVLNKAVELVNPAGVDDADKYDRLLRYVTVGGKDLGTAVLQAGLANARYDSLDGYDRHPKQDDYRAISTRTEHVCATAAAKAESEQAAAPQETSEPASAAEPWNEPGPDLDCGDIKQKVQITGTDYHRLDADGDGWGCESYG